MKSKVQVKGHPLHPILVSFPIAFFVATLIMDIVSLSYQLDEFKRLAFYLEAAGIGCALLAAVPGFIDFLFTVPPNSSGKKRAATHGLINVTMVAVFTIAWLVRQNANIPFLWVIIMEIAGVTLLSIAGWMGGTLVYRNQIGIDIRYADAGKWNEAHIEKATGKIEVATIEELKVNNMKLLHVGNLRIVICRTEKGYAAFDDRCTHRGGSLAGGAMICSTVQCPWHGSQFDVQSGNVKAGPATENIKTYLVRESEGKVFITLN
jgi:uncharacterized membrane protein/nitrite reductase/ring-hydroxylating ferredoxin subunit